jgi:2-polyprenyl-3-methyl-5-hydroxy-6-metoxy-1,4-benzoquinol methylase
MSDWTGNSRSAHAILGARNYAQNEREVNDYYATEPKAAQLLMEVEQFAPMIWECACGEGHLAKEFERAGYHVYATDLIDRGFGHQQDFLKCQAPPRPRIRHHYKPAIFKGTGVCQARP